jgi:hypothetical protein
MCRVLRKKSRRDISSGFGLHRPDRQSFTGWQLVAGTAPLVPERPDPRDTPVRPPAEEELRQFRVPPEPFAQIAFAAVLVGLGAAVVVHDRASRELIAALAATIVVTSMWLLVSSPSLKKIGVLKVQPEIGYWLVLGLSVITAVLHYLLWRGSRSGGPEPWRRSVPPSRSRRPVVEMRPP